MIVAELVAGPRDGETMQLDGIGIVGIIRPRDSDALYLFDEIRDDGSVVYVYNRYHWRAR